MRRHALLYCHVCCPAAPRPAAAPPALPPTLGARSPAALVMMHHLALLATGDWLRVAERSCLTVPPAHRPRCRLLPLPTLAAPPPQKSAAGRLPRGAPRVPSRRAPRGGQRGGGGAGQRGGSGGGAGRHVGGAAALAVAGRSVGIGGGGGARTRARRYHNPFPHLLTIIRWAFNRRPKDRCGRCRGWRCRGWLVGPTD